MTESTLLSRREKMEHMLKEYFFQKRHLLILLCSVFLSGLLLGGSLYWHAKRQVADKNHEIEQLANEKKDILRKLAASEVEARILRASQADLKNIIQQREQELSEQSTSLEFYRQLMVEDGEKEGLELNNYKITVTKDPQSFQFQMTFIQYSKTHQDFNAQLTFGIEGTLKGQHKLYDFFELMHEPDKDFGRIQFKYFKIVEGLIYLPAGFMPQQIIVKNILGKTKNAKEWERHLIWHVEEN